MVSDQSGKPGGSWRIRKFESLGESEGPGILERPRCPEGLEDHENRLWEVDPGRENHEGRDCG